MAREHDRSDSFRSPKFSRREFVVQLAALAGLLAGCSPSEQPMPTRAPAPTPVPSSAPARDWQVTERRVGLSDILLSCDTLINIPILKQHHESGVTFAMKNHYGTFDRPSAFHGPRMGTAIAELNALPPIRDRTRLVIGDALTVCPTGNWGSAVPHGSILLSFDPAAHDTAGLQLLSELMVSYGRNPQATAKLASRWLTKSVELGLGTNDPKNVELVEVSPV